MPDKDSDDVELDKLLTELESPPIVEEADIPKKEKAEWDKPNTETDTYEYSDEPEYDKNMDTRKHLERNDLEW